MLIQGTNLFILGEQDEHGDQICFQPLDLNYASKLSELGGGSPADHRGVVLAEHAERRSQLCLDGRRHLGVSHTEQAAS